MSPAVPAPAPGSRIAASARRRLRTLLALPLLAVPFFASTAPAAAQRMPGDTVEVLSLRFAGAERFTDALLRSAIMTVPTQCTSVALQPFCLLGLSRQRGYLDLRALTGDVARLRLFYYQRGYRDASIALDTTRVSGGMHILFRVHEGEPVVVQSIAIEGADEIAGALQRNLPLRVGEPFSQPAFEATRDTLIMRLANRGYAAADALANYEIRADDRYRADVEFMLMPGPLTRFGPVAVTGTERIAPSVVERMLYFREGDVYSRERLLRSQRNLFTLEVFRHAEIVATPVPDADSILAVEVRVIEGDMHRVRVGLGVSSSEFVNAEGRWISRNFLGEGRRLEARGRISNMISEPLGPLPVFESCTGIYCDVSGSLNADFSQPWFFGPQNALSAGLFLERFTLQDVYVRTSQGGYGSVRRTVFGNGVLAAVYRLELTSLESEGDLIFCVNFVACEEREIDVLRDPHWLAPVGLSLTRDRSNSLFSPTRGHVLRLEAEYAGTATGSAFSYARLLGELSFYHDPFRGVVLATRLRPGWSRATGAPGSGLGVHPQKRFFAGGPNSVRGFAQYRLGPKLLTVAADTLLAPVQAGGAGCTAQQINGGTCDVTALAAEHPGTFEQRPVGGSVVLEGNMEVRFPVWGDRLRAATFLDFGQVWRDEQDVRLGSLQWTPGLGIRYFSPVGPIRIDVGYNPGGLERLTVVTTEVCYQPVSTEPCTEILPDVEYAPGDLVARRRLRALPAIAWRPYGGLMDRLQFHFSIGQAF